MKAAEGIHVLTLHVRAAIAELELVVDSLNDLEEVLKEIEKEAQKDG